MCRMEVAENLKMFTDLQKPKIKLAIFKHLFLLCTPTLFLNFFLSIFVCVASNVSTSKIFYSKLVYNYPVDSTG